VIHHVISCNDIGIDINGVVMGNRIVICPYCGKKAEFKTGREIYAGRGSWDGKKFWVCEPCNAWVGCHDRNKRYGRVGDEPLGRLANKELREAKMKAHLAFDPIWKEKSMKRKEAYAWLAKKLGIPAEECHIGMFDVDMCREVVIVMSDYSLVVANAICGHQLGELE
jgi:hypothetical protein